MSYGESPGSGLGTTAWHPQSLSRALWVGAGWRDPLENETNDQMKFQISNFDKRCHSLSIRFSSSCSDVWSITILSLSLKEYNFDSNAKMCVNNHYNSTTMYYNMRVVKAKILSVMSYFCLSVTISEYLCLFLIILVICMARRLMKPNVFA